MIYGQVYMLQHNITGRIYIGCSKDVPKRIGTHFSLLRCGKHNVEDMQADFDRYGCSFTLSTLGTADGSHPNLEFEMMDKYRSTIRGIGYNYKDQHTKLGKRSTKSKLHKLIDELDEEQMLYAYTFLSKKFGRPKNE